MTSISDLIIRLAFKAKLHWRGVTLAHLSGLLGSMGLSTVLERLEEEQGVAAVSILRHCGALVGYNARILRGLVIHNADQSLANLQIGQSCHIGRQVFLDLAGPIRVGDRVTISMRCCVITHTNVGDSTCGVPTEIAGVTLGDDVYVGAGAILMPGIIIGRGAVVAAGAVVIRDVAPHTVVGGVPGRLLGGRVARGIAVGIDQEQSGA